MNRKFGVFHRTFEGEGAGTGEGGSVAALGAGDQQQQQQQQQQQPPPAFFEGFTDPAVKELMKTKNYADVNALGAAYFNLNKLQNGARDVVGLPKDANDADGWNKLHTALGRPEKADGYAFTFDKEAKVHPKMEAFAKELFFGMGASPERAQAGVAKWQTLVTEIMTEEAEAAKIESEKAITGLKAQWGQSWDTNVASGQNAVKAMGIQDATLQALDKAIGVPAVLELFAIIGKKLGVERTMVDPPNNGVGGGGFAVQTPEAARAEIQRLSNDKAFQDSMRNMRDPERQNNVAKWSKLHEVAYPPKK